MCPQQESNQQSPKLFDQYTKTSISILLIAHSAFLSRFRYPRVFIWTTIQLKMASLEAFGFVSTVLGDIGFLQSSLPPAAPHIMVRIYAGLGASSSTGTGGDAPTVALWDSVGTFLGSTGETDQVIGDGEFIDMPIPPLSTISAEYMAVAAYREDDICIASISVTMANGQDTLAMYGDIASQCGAPWYLSNEILGDNNFKPRCVWITSEPTDQHPYQGFGIHLPDFTPTDERTAQYNSNRASMCHAQPRFSMYTDINEGDTIPIFKPPLIQTEGTLVDQDPNAVPTAPMVQADAITGLLTPITARPLGNAVDGVASGPSSVIDGKVVAPQTQSDGSSRRSRRQTTGSSWMQTHLIVSQDSQHTATVLCESATSSGPDFVSLSEGLFCDMDEKELWPLCSSANATTSCFDMASNTLLLPTASSENKRRAAGWNKVYERVTQWT